MKKQKVFSGRVIFDHLTKTAGQAVNAWLRSSLGSGCVSPNLIGCHHKLIQRYGGQYSIISGHIHFQIAGEGLDPRYNYITSLREPLDRAISWLYYNVQCGNDAHELTIGAKQFLDSEGIKSNSTFLNSITNQYTKHFYRIVGGGWVNNDEKIAIALTAIQQYDVVGLYEQLPEFLADVADLIGFYPPQSIAYANVNPQRPSCDCISPSLLNRITEINQQDIKLYEKVKSWKETRKDCMPDIPRIACEGWEKYDEIIHDRIVTTPDVTIHSVKLNEGYHIVTADSMISFEVDYSVFRSIAELELGIHLYDEDGEWAFGTNTTLLGKVQRHVESGSYCETFTMLAKLPTGIYSAGFSATEISAGGSTELAWHDRLCKFEVVHTDNQVFDFYMSLPTWFTQRKINPIWKWSGKSVSLQTNVGRREQDRITTTGIAGFLIYGPYVNLPPGTYQAIFSGEIGVGGVGTASADITVDTGNSKLIETIVGPVAENGILANLTFTILEDGLTLETRLKVDDTSDLSVTKIEILPTTENLKQTVLQTSKAKPTNRVDARIRLHGKNRCRTKIYTISDS